MTTQYEKASAAFKTWKFIPPWDTLEQAFRAGYHSGKWDERRRHSPIDPFIAASLPTTNTESTIWIERDTAPAEGGER